MTTPSKYLAAAVAAALVGPAALAGCSSVPSDDTVISTLDTAVASAVSHATDVTVGMGYDGPDRRTVSVRLYLDEVGTAVVASAVDSALHTVWSESPVLPSSVVVSVVDGPKPTDGSKGVGIDLSDTAISLGIPVPEVGRDLLLVRAAELEKLYGPRPTS